MSKKPKALIKLSDFVSFYVNVCMFTCFFLQLIIHTYSYCKKELQIATNTHNTARERKKKVPFVSSEIKNVC